MKLVLPGGSGQVGTLLARAWTDLGHEVVVLTRDARPEVRRPWARRTGAWRTEAWDGRTLGPWQRELDGADAVINLAGRSVNCRYTESNRNRIMSSRVDSTRVVGEAIARCARPPRVWLQMSTATIYAHRIDAPNDETTGVLGGGEPGAPASWRASVEVGKAWERALDEATVPATRRIALRTTMVMSPDPGGIFDTMLGLVRRGLGGTAGSGRQFVSWIHEHDMVRALDFLIARDDIAGPVNIGSPEPLPYAEFMRVLRHAAGVRIGLPAASWMLEIGAFFMGTETELVLKSRYVVPGRLVASGFTFEHRSWPAAAQELCSRSARTRTAPSP